MDLILISSTDLNKSLLDIFYLNLLFFSVSIVFLAIGYVKWGNTYKELKRAIEFKENIDSFAPEGNRLEQILIREIIDLKNKEKLRETEELKKNLEEINDYITKWIHEIKIPLSVCELMADKLEGEELYDLSKELIQETERIIFLVNQVLHMSRASSYSQDFIVEEVNLSSLVKSVVKNNMNSFIYKKIELEIDNLDFNIFTDRKWAYYVIEQIINNACKYVDTQGRVEIYGEETDESIILTIRDNGIILDNPEDTKDLTFKLAETLPMESGLYTYYLAGVSLYDLVGIVYFLGAFLFLVFVFATGSIIYFKILSESFRDKSKYEILKKLGTTDIEINESVSKQVGFFFILPLIVGIIHSIVAISVLSNIMKYSLTIPAVISIGVFIIVYGIFYVFTRRKYVNVVGQA